MRKFCVSVLLFIVPFVLKSQLSEDQKTVIKDLRKAYKKHNVKLAIDFFENWMKEIVPVSNDELKSLENPIKEAYKVFEVFYNPLEIKKIGGSEWGDSIYNEVKYAIVQNRIKVSVVETLDKDEIIQKNIENSPISDSLKSELLKKVNGEYSYDAMILYGGILSVIADEESIESDTIKNFRPRVEIENLKVVYLNKKYAEILNRYLKKRYFKLGKGRIMNPAKSKKGSERRQDFLENLIKIYQGHWGGYWQLVTYPEVNLILFDKEMENAIIYFRIIYEGGEARLKKTEGKWQLIESKRTWIE